MALQHPTKNRHPQTPGPRNNTPVHAPQTGTTSTPHAEELQAELQAARHTEKLLRRSTWTLALVTMCLPVAQALGQLHASGQPAGDASSGLVDICALLMGCLALPALNSLAHKAQQRVVAVTSRLPAARQ
jgi:hypothetical protein